MVTKLLTAHYTLGLLVARNKGSGGEGGICEEAGSLASPRHRSTSWLLAVLSLLSSFVSLF